MSRKRASKVWTVVGVFALSLWVGCGANGGGQSAASARDGGGDAGGADVRSDTRSTSGDAGCGTDHRKVGWTAELQAKGNYDVSGTATIVDGCTVAIENFTYSGDGIVVQVYGTGRTKSGSDAPDFEKGYAMSEDLVGREFRDERFVVTLPENKTLDDLIGLSVWCVDASVDFGSGRFGP